MASKRHLIDYAEDSYTDEEDEMEMEMEVDIGKKYVERPRPGRPRKVSLTTSSSMEANSSNNIAGLSSTMSVTNGAPTVRRRGRGPSKRPCLNRNALMARENRQRKKEYIERIETRLQHFQNENQSLKETIQRQSTDIKRLTNDVMYLRSVLNQSTTITTLLQSMNESLRKMHGNNDNATSNDNAVSTSTNNLAKSNSVAINRCISGQMNSSKTNNLSAPVSGSTPQESLEVRIEDKKRINFGQFNKSAKIARKTMPFTNSLLPKSENPSSVESILEEDEKNFVQKSSPESGSHCEYNMVDKSSMGLDNQLPTTPISITSNSVDKGDASLSDTDFSQLSSFNVDLFDNFDKFDEAANPLGLSQDTPDIFNEETLFHTLEKDTGILNNDVIDPLEIGLMSDALNEKTLFNSLENTGVCLHINSSRVSLEYCSICHLNSLNSSV